MKKLIEDHRRRFEDFEVVEFVDPNEIEALRRQTEVPVPLQLHWTWDYGDQVAELRNLYEKGKVNQWNASRDLDWSVPVTPDEWVIDPNLSLLATVTRLMGKDEAIQKAAAFDELGYLLSQLLHGEQAALQLCGQLTNACELMEEKWYAASQVADEARHIEALAGFLQRKMGTLYPVGPTLKILLDELLSADTARKKTLGMQCLFEGMAVGIFDALRRESSHPLLVDMIRRIEQDEARHAAFGVLCMRRAVREAAPGELEEMEDWAFSVLEALNANQNLDMLQTLGPKYGIDPEEVTRASLKLPNFAELNSQVYVHTVIPNLLGLGLITERTEPRYRALGMMVGFEGRSRRTPGADAA